MKDAMRAPCGCKFGTVDDIFVIEPCSLTCEVYAYAHTESRKRGMSMSAPIDLSNVGKLEVFTPRCPHCDAKLDGFAGPQGKRPTFGALTLCMYCGEFAFFGLDQLRKPTEAEIVEINNDEQLRDLQAMTKGNLREYPFDDRRLKQ
jgi:hypothetical protein